MTSFINISVPVAGNPTTQSVRDNFVIVKNEIEALQSKNNLSGVITGNATGTTTLTPNGTNSTQLAVWISDKTGSGSIVFANGSTLNNITLVNAALGTPVSGNLTNCNGTAAGLTAGNVTNMPNLSGVITGNATGTTTLTANGVNSSQLAAWISDKTGNGSIVFANGSTLTNITLVNAALGTPVSGNLTSCSGIPVALAVGILPVANGGVDQAGWIAWTPTLTNVTLGNGTLDCKHKVIGKTCFYRFKLVVGSTTIIGTNPQFSLPFTSVAPPSPYVSHGKGEAVTAAVALYPIVATWSSNTTATLYSPNSPYTTITATAPFTWATGCILSVSGQYELA